MIRVASARGGLEPPFAGAPRLSQAAPSGAAFSFAESEPQEPQEVGDSPGPQISEADGSEVAKEDEVRLPTLPLRIIISRAGLGSGDG